MKAEKITLGPWPDFQKGDTVRVALENIRPWEGVVTAIKPSSESGWWIDVVDEDGMTQQCQASVVELVARTEESGNAALGLLVGLGVGLVLWTLFGHIAVALHNALGGVL
jgi:hypothetical protein